LDVLELLAAKPEALAHGDIARALRMPKSSLTELLATLEDRRYVTREADRFRLGSEVLALAGAMLRRTDVVRLAQPVVAGLMLRTGESASLVLRQGASVVVVCKENCDQPILYSLQLGQRGPLNASAGGKAILAHAAKAEREAYLSAGPLIAATSRSIIDPAALRRELAAVARSGIAFSREEMVEGIVAMGFPVFDAQGAPCAGLSVGIPSLRFDATKERLAAEALRSAGAEISLALGWRSDERRAAE
jgi:DNA-binding IclR family transcriptional regulator